MMGASDWASIPSWIGAAVSAGVAAYFGAYLRTRAERRVTEETLDRVPGRRPTGDLTAGQGDNMANNATQNLRNANDHSGHVKFGHYVVTLIDFLGQQSKLAKWDFLPETEYDKQEFISAVRGSFGKVMAWRDQFQKNAKLWLKSRQLPESITKSTPDGGQAYREYADMSLNFMHFSDTIVIYSPIVNQFGHSNAATVLSHMYTCGALILAALNQHTVFRGAIEIGMAGAIDDAGIYGPVLASAHQLENRVAEYPRLMVGDRLHQYLKAQAMNPDNSAPSRVNRHIADICLRLAGEDLDGKRILDYMGGGFVEMACAKDGWQMLRDGACAFAERERDRFRRSGDQKLADRYDRLCKYQESRRASS